MRLWCRDVDILFDAPRRYGEAYNALQDDVRAVGEERDDAVHRLGLAENRRRRGAGSG